MMKRNNYDDDIWNRLFKKGGSAHFSLSGGAKVHVRGESPVTLVDAIDQNSLQEWRRKEKEIEG